MKTDPEPRPADMECRGPVKSGIMALPDFSDRRGILTVAEAAAIPFPVERVFWICGVPSGRGRGGHAHRRQWQLIVAAGGSFTVILDDGETTVAHRLDHPSTGLLVAPGTWNILENFSADAVCLVFASGPYDEEEYIREYPDFIAFKAK